MKLNWYWLGLNKLENYKSIICDIQSTDFKWRLQTESSPMNYTKSQPDIVGFTIQNMS